MYDPKTSEMLDQFAAMMPEMMAAFGISDFGSTLTEFISTYLYGMLLLLLPLVFIIMLANRLIMSYIDNGSMAYLLATPNTRKKIVTTQAIVLVFSLFLLISLTTLIEIITIAALFPEELEINSLLLLNAGLFCLHFAISSMCFFISCSSKDSQMSYGLSIAIPVGFYLIQALANIGGKLEDLKYATIFSLYSPEQILANDSQALWLCAVLVIIGIIFYGLAIRIFVKRDLNL